MLGPLHSPLQLGDATLARVDLSRTPLGPRVNTLNAVNGCRHMDTHELAETGLIEALGCGLLR